MNDETVLLVFFGTAAVFIIIPVLRRRCGCCWGNSVDGAVTVAVCNWTCSTGIGTLTPGPEAPAAAAKFLASRVFDFEFEHKESEDTTAAGPCCSLLVMWWLLGVGVVVDDDETVHPISTRRESIKVSLYPRLWQGILAAAGCGTRCCCTRCCCCGRCESSTRPVLFVLKYVTNCCRWSSVRANHCCSWCCRCCCCCTCKCCSSNCFCCWRRSGGGRGCSGDCDCG